MSDMRNSHDKDWDDCDKPLDHPATHSHLTPSVADIHHFTRVNAVKSGLVNATVQKNPAIDLASIVSDVPYQRNLGQTSTDSTHENTMYTELEEKILPKSFKLAVRNRLARQQIERANSKHGLPFFFYGAQMFPAIVLATCGMEQSLEQMTQNMAPAFVHGFSRLALKNRGYPSAVKSHGSNSVIQGMVVIGIQLHSLDSLERFKAKNTELHRVQITTETRDGTACMLEAAMYVQKYEDDPLLIPIESRTWQVTDLMADVWHLKNLVPFEKQERALVLP